MVFDVKIPGLSRVMLLARRSAGDSRRSSCRDAGSTGGGRAKSRADRTPQSERPPTAGNRWIRGQTRRCPRVSRAATCRVGSAASSRLARRVAHIPLGRSRRPTKSFENPDHVGDRLAPGRMHRLHRHHVAAPIRSSGSPARTPAAAPVRAGRGPARCGDECVAAQASHVGDEHQQRN